jgi:hypothetical protein
LTSVRAAIADVQFTIEGEQHAAARIAPPHPGHSAGGEVTGELPGRFILRWDAAAPTTLGLATLIVGDYQGANFGFRAADQSDGLAADDPLVGHALHVTGTVERDGATTGFDAVLDVEVDTAMIGAPFAAVITETATAPLAIAFSPTDPTEGDTAFDGPRLRDPAGHRRRPHPAARLRRAQRAAPHHHHPRSLQRRGCPALTVRLRRSHDSPHQLLRSRLRSSPPVPWP